MNRSDFKLQPFHLLLNVPNTSKLQHKVVAMRTNFDLGVRLTLATNEDLNDLMLPKPPVGSRATRRWWVSIEGRV